jgi:hypothetical protein
MLATFVSLCVCRSTLTIVNGPLLRSLGDLGTVTSAPRKVLSSSQPMKMRTVAGADGQHGVKPQYWVDTAFSVCTSMATSWLPPPLVRGWLTMR